MSTRSFIFCLAVSLVVIALAATVMVLFAAQSSTGWSLLLVGVLIAGIASVQAGVAGKWATVPVQGVKQS
ncbi:hypothetical protein [Ketobacter alkanivorans]|uniref:Uncharacterized protein n=1 Tax=Ketobacter alkanivorans TaxID=1917421 RepID=A0A2K9LLS1_9GAMM|nr:hypothetical protein [Ketobacter alkanivorans]AUM13299.1 hypothetical protein Kalk_13085 [Ketobacter alkanivorans]MCP5016776.1 hypothetical protein [Ketobacter sp.]